MLNRGGAETPRENQLTDPRSTTSDLFEAFQEIGRIADELYVPVLKQGIKRSVNRFQETSASPRLGGE